jgi:hypothetical protein
LLRLLERPRTQRVEPSGPLQLISHDNKPSAWVKPAERRHIPEKTPSRAVETRSGAKHYGFSNFMIPVPLLNPKFATELAAMGMRTSGSRHQSQAAPAPKPVRKRHRRD